MISLHTRILVADVVHDTLVLPFEQRERCRQRARLASGEEVALFLVRGTVLREMVAGLGADVSEELAKFEPEAGAYGGGHGHHHDQGPGGLLAPVPLRQKIHRPSDIAPLEPGPA